MTCARSGRSSESAGHPRWATASTGIPRAPDRQRARARVRDCPPRLLRSRRDPVTRRRWRARRGWRAAASHSELPPSQETWGMVWRYAYPSPDVPRPAVVMNNGLDLETVHNFGTALLIGALVGIEREKRKSAE